jgi:hypothetical protein
MSLLSAVSPVSVQSSETQLARLNQMYKVAIRVTKVMRSPAVMINFTLNLAWIISTVMLLAYSESRALFGWMTENYHIPD